MASTNDTSVPGTDRGAVSPLHKWFAPEMRTMAQVPRWPTVWTINRDDVASHSFMVAFYSKQIAQVIEWDGNYGLLMYAALLHDTDETITGDIVSPVKKALLSDAGSKQYIDDKYREKFGGENASVLDLLRDPSEDITRIVKVADRLDALFFLIFEQRLGNNFVGSLMEDANSRLFESWKNLPAEEIVLDDLWRRVIAPAITAHFTVGGFGV